jgi:hypothetical protein
VLPPQASERRGVLIAFIILDNPAASLLDMRTVSFVDGKPVFAQVRCCVATGDSVQVIQLHNDACKLLIHRHA